MFSSASGDWETPDDLYCVLDQEFHFTMDASSRKEGFNAFEDAWEGNVYVNPPYGPDIWYWLERGWTEIRNAHAKIIVWLLPARTDTRWFHEHVLGQSEIRFIRGRLRFKGAKSSAPFPSMIVIFRGVF